jgi:hypothetical protein
VGAFLKTRIKYIKAVMELQKDRINEILLWPEQKVDEYLAAVPSDFEGSLNDKKDFILDLEHASLNGSITPAIMQ